MGDKALTQRRSLADAAYGAILQRLISLQIAPNEHISVDALVRELEISQTPIRAALARLEANGLVVRKHNSGFTATPLPSGKRFRDTFELRLLLEPRAAATAAVRMTDAQRRRLVALNGKLADLSRADVRTGYSTFALIDAEFHDHVAQVAGNEVIAETLSRLYIHLQLFRLRLHTMVTSGAVEEHEKIIRAITEADATAASEAMEAHILASRGRMLPFFGLND